jgi:hypothetical protein
MCKRGLPEHKSKHLLSWNMKADSGVPSRGKKKDDEDERESNLFALPFNPLKYGLECAISKAAFLTSFLVILISNAHSLWSEVESISEWFVNTCQNISTSHEDLLH